jgi:hypothetical protein
VVGIGLEDDSVHWLAGKRKCRFEKDFWGKLALKIICLMVVLRVPTVPALLSMAQI